MSPDHMPPRRSRDGQAHNEYEPQGHEGPGTQAPGSQSSGRQTGYNQSQGHPYHSPQSPMDGAANEPRQAQGGSAYPSGARTTATNPVIGQPQGATGAPEHSQAAQAQAPQSQATQFGPFGANNGPEGPGIGPVGTAKNRQPRRWSTTALVAMVAATAVFATALTHLAMSNNGDPLSHSTTTSFDSKGSGDQHGSAGDTSRLDQPGNGTEIADKVLNSVVSIQVRTAQGGGEGSGSILSNDGLIVTNNHVIAGADNGRGQIQVMLNDGRALKAKLVATDPQTDIAVIKAEGANDLQPIALGDSDALKVGEPVMAVGSPLGLSSTVTSGIVSAKNRPVQAAGEQGGESSLIDAIQTDAAINPGNSGGALVNAKGELVGIPSVIATLGTAGQGGNIGLGFAIPANQGEDIAKQLIEKGKVQHPIIGAQVNTASDAYGAEIREVNKGSAAEKAGLKSGDVVLKVDDRPIDSGVGLIAAIRSHKVGETVTLHVGNSNGGDERDVQVTLDEEK